MGVCTKERKGGTAEVLMATLCTDPVFDGASMNDLEASKVSSMKDHMHNPHGFFDACMRHDSHGTCIPVLT